MRSVGFCLAAVAMCISSAAFAQTLNSSLSGVGFLIGQWNSGAGKVADTGGTSKGSSVITVEANGAALLRRDHTKLFDSVGKPAGSFDQIMLIYPEDGMLHADYTDGQHIIHYTSATVTAGKSVTFTSASDKGPVFRLSYDLVTPRALAVSFGMIPPGQTTFHPIASGTLLKSN